MRFYLKDPLLTENLDVLYVKGDYSPISQADLTKYQTYSQRAKNETQNLIAVMEHRQLPIFAVDFQVEFGLYSKLKIDNSRVMDLSIFSKFFVSLLLKEKLAKINPPGRNDFRFKIPSKERISKHLARNFEIAKQKFDQIFAKKMVFDMFRKGKPPLNQTQIKMRRAGINGAEVPENLIIFSTEGVNGEILISFKNPI